MEPLKGFRLEAFTECERAKDNLKYLRDKYLSCFLLQSSSERRKTCLPLLNYPPGKHHTAVLKSDQEMAQGHLCVSPLQLFLKREHGGAFKKMSKTHKSRTKKYKKYALPTA